MVVMDQVMQISVESRSSVWCPAVTGFGKSDSFVHLKPPQKAISVHSVPVLLGLVAWQLPFAIQLHSEFCPALTGVVPVPCRWGGHNTTQVCGLTPAILAKPKIKSGSKPSFQSASELSGGTLLRESFDSLILVESVLLLSV